VDDFGEEGGRDAGAVKNQKNLKITFFFFSMENTQLTRVLDSLIFITAVFTIHVHVRELQYSQQVISSREDK